MRRVFEVGVFLVIGGVIIPSDKKFKKIKFFLF